MRGRFEVRPQQWLGTFHTGPTVRTLKRPRVRDRAPMKIPPSLAPYRRNFDLMTENGEQSVRFRISFET